MEAGRLAPVLYNPRMTRTFLLALMLFAASPIGPALAIELPAWQAGEERDHPALGKVLAPGRETTLREVADSLAEADFALLGETHDNPDHHAIQAALVEAMAAAGRRPAIVFEMIPTSLQAEIDAFLASDDPDPAGFGAAVRWEERGWPAWEMYRPILEAALRHDLPVRAGDIDRDVLRRVSREGSSALAPELVARYGLDRDLEPARSEMLLRAIDEGHCGLMPAAALEPMIGVQRARDGALADALVQAREAGADGAVLIAGSGHTRKDYGVGYLLPLLVPGASIVSVEAVEALAGQEPAPDAHDFAIVTPRQQREDQCEKLRQALRKKQ